MIKFQDNKMIVEIPCEHMDQATEYRAVLYCALTVLYEKKVNENLSYLDKIIFLQNIFLSKNLPAPAIGQNAQLQNKQQEGPT